MSVPGRLPVSDVAPPLLETAGLTKTYGGLEAVRDVDFRLQRGEIRAIIGPNGAGKTTLVGVISGRFPATAGRVFFEGRDISRLRAHDRVALGIVYTFQIISIFRRRSVEENVALAAQRRLFSGTRDHVRLDSVRLGAAVARALEQVGLHDAIGQVAGSLPYGHQRLLELAMALAAQPQVLILDEPTQGLGPNEIASLSALIRSVAQSVTVLLIEHNMRVVLDLSQRITVMDRGRIIADGRPGEIEANPEVQRVYLGR